MPWFWVVSSNALWNSLLSQTPQEECPTSWEALHSFNPLVVFPLNKEYQTRLILKLNYFIFVIRRWWCGGLAQGSWGEACGFVWCAVREKVFSITAKAVLKWAWLKWLYVHLYHAIILRKNISLLTSQKETKIRTGGASLVAQWLRIRLPMQETRVRALVWEDPTCREGTKPVRHTCWACALEPVCHNYRSPRP